MGGCWGVRLARRSGADPTTSSWRSNSTDACSCNVCGATVKRRRPPRVALRCRHRKCRLELAPGPPGQAGSNVCCKAHADYLRRKAPLPLTSPTQLAAGSQPSFDCAFPAERKTAGLALEARRYRMSPRDERCDRSFVPGRVARNGVIESEPTAEWIERPSDLEIDWAPKKAAVVSRRRVWDPGGIRIQGRSIDSAGAATLRSLRISKESSR